MNSLIFLNFGTDTNIALHSPVEGSANPLCFRAMGYAWDKESIARDGDIKITIQLKRISDGYSLSFPAARSAVKSGEQVLFHLAAFSSQLSLPSAEGAGSWLISARMTTASGHIIETAPRKIIIDPHALSREFHFFSFEHITALYLLLAGCIIIVLMFIKTRNRHLVFPASLLLIGILWINEFIYRIYWVGLGSWAPTNALMLQMCGLALLMIPFALFTWQPKLRRY